MTVIARSQKQFFQVIYNEPFVMSCNLVKKMWGAFFLGKGEKCEGEKFNLILFDLIRFEI